MDRTRDLRMFVAGTAIPRSTAELSIPSVQLTGVSGTPYHDLHVKVSLGVENCSAGCGVTNEGAGAGSDKRKRHWPRTYCGSQDSYSI